jgi:hypothetical protein
MQHVSMNKDIENRPLVQWQKTTLSMEVVSSKPGWEIFMDNYEIWDLNSHPSDKKKTDI